MHRFCRNSSVRGVLPLAWLGLGALLLAGCGGAPDPQFRTNEAYLVSLETNSSPLPEDKRDDVKQNVKEVLIALFGTPDDPRFPTIDGIDTSSIVDVTKLKMAAGPVNSDIYGKPFGLYREHCAHCHGITGDGRGPTAAFLNPYPRDYRRGLYKFKSTPVDIPPTHDDLNHILVNGIPGTAMPSFRLLPKDEIEALIHYVRYLSIRGRVEQILLATAVDLGDQVVNVSDDAAASSQWGDVMGIVEEVTTAWAGADALATAVPAPPSNFESPDSVARGRELFFSQTAKCASCHGDTALGDGETNDFDVWTKELVPADPELRDQLLASGAILPPRNIRPRNLRMNVFRGGRRPVDLYWRVHNGITGTPMPAASLRPADAGEDDPRLTTDDVWHLVAYVRSLPFDDLSSPVTAPSFQRDRQ
jgi:mono/diheme cytochrome c family protein